MTRASQLSGRRHIFVTPVAAVSLQRGRKRGAGGAAAPPLFEKVIVCPPTFLVPATPLVRQRKTGVSDI